MRKTNSIFIGYIGRCICPKCQKKGYAYIKQNFDRSTFVKINHYAGWNKAKNRNIMTYCFCDVNEVKKV